jgi:DNA-binding LacI/PurR family transcriptional regulator
VSTATVSKVLSNTPYVSEKTRQKVLAIVDEMGYVPNLAARGLSKARTFIIGLAFPYASGYVFEDPHLLAFMRGVEEIAAESTYNVLLIPARAGERADSSLQRLLRTQYIDGAIIVGLQQMEEAVPLLRRRTFPTVSLGYHDPSGNIIHADDRKGALQATRHLIALGHKDIGIISAGVSLTALDERLTGYKTGLSEATIQFRPELIRHGDFTEQSGETAAADLVALEKPPTAIFSFNDRMAIGAIRRLKRTGLRVPEDIAVIGFDDIPAAAMYEPALTTVRQPAFEMGKTAVHVLLGLIEDKDDHVSSAILPSLLVVRDSCGGSH